MGPFSDTNPARSSPRGEYVRPRAVTLIALAAPVILLNLTFVVIQITDALLVGWLGNRELAALTPPSMAIFVIVSFGYAFLSVVTTYVAQSLGAARYEECGRYAWIGIYAALAFGALAVALWPIGAVFELFAGSAAGSLGDFEARYFRVSLLAMPAVLLTNAIANFYFGIRRPRPVLIASLIGVLLNVGASYVLIFGAFGVSPIGFDGAAWGTVIATAMEGALLLGWFFVDPANRKFATRRPARSLSGFGELWDVALPSGVQGAIDVLSWGVLLSMLIAAHGEAALAAGTVLMRCMQVTFLPAEGVATVVVALVGNSVGFGRPMAAREHVKIGFRINAIYMVGMGVLFFLFREPIARAFTDDPEAISITVSCMVFVTLAQWFDAMNLTYIHALQGVGDTRWPSLVNIGLSIAILAAGGAIAITWLRAAGPTLVWFLALIYMIGQGQLFRWRWNSNSWRDIELSPAAANAGSQ